MPGPIHTAPPDSGTAVRGKTLPALLYDACARFPNPHALHQPQGESWHALSLDAFRTAAEEVALGLLDLGLDRGDRVGLFMESDVPFCIVDMGCLLGGLIDVPVYLTHTDDAVGYVLDHAGAKALVVSTRAHLAQVAPLLADLPAVRHVVLAEGDADAAPPMPEGVDLLTLAELRVRGRAVHTPQRIDALRDRLAPDDLATIIYTSGTTGRPKGVLLTHENLSFNAVTAFNGLGDFEGGPDGDVVLSFLPLTHVFARALHYGNIAHGATVYFSSPEDLTRALQAVRPTIFATVPRLLEKVYARIREQAATLTGVRKLLLNWALDLAHRYELGREPEGLYRFQLVVADVLVFRRWRDALGGRVRHVICGGAALSPDLANLFAAAGVQVLQGYGLTETSPVITFNRPHLNRAGTVGVPLPDVEVRIADDGEILTRGPHVMKGYFHDDEKTAEVIDAEGWFHTGDVGEFTDEGFLRITDRKKDLFKLSTGKYVMPQPLENRLTTEPLIEQAVVVGAGYKFCTALLFPDQEMLRVFARTRGLDETMPMEALVRHPVVVARYEQLVEAANRGMDRWSTIKRFALVPHHLTVENGLLTPTLKVKRAGVHERFADRIDGLYRDAEAVPA